MSGRTIRVLVADDHPLFRQGLRGILDAAADVEVVGEASTGRKAVALALELEPDVVLMDLHMPELGGLEATRRLLAQRPGVRVLVLTMIEEDAAVLASLRAGARGYLLKGADRDEVVRAVRAVAAGDLVLGVHVADRIPDLLQQRSSTRAFPELTEREHEVLELIARGSTNAEIANALGLSLKTVRNNVSNVLNKLRVAGRAQAIVKAREAGLGRTPA